MWQEDEVNTWGKKIWYFYLDRCRDRHGEGKDLSQALALGDEPLGVRKKKVEMASTLKTHKLKDRPLTLRPGSACVALNTLKVNYPCQQELGKSHRCLEHICHLLDREKNGKKPGQA